MSDTTINSPDTKRSATRKVNSLVTKLLGNRGRETMDRVGQVALSSIQRAFAVKMAGGTDEAGDRWAPLSPYTIAYRRGRTRTERKRDARPSQALTTRQRERWWSLYGQGLVIFNGDKASAAKRAWAILKSEGAQTLFDKYAGRHLDILRDTGLLYKSLQSHGKPRHQVFRVNPGEVTIGTDRAGAIYHHEGVPNRLPQRRLWPEPSRWPQSWWSSILMQIRRGVVEILTESVGR